MPYAPLNIPEDVLGSKVRDFIRNRVDPVLEDIREMMCIAIRSEQGGHSPARQLQHPIATLLVNVISGCADSLMVTPEKLDNKKSFVKFLTNYAPSFHGDMSLSGGPETLYTYFRNPLVHRLAVPYKDLIFTPRIIMGFPGQSYSELDSRIRKLEQSKTHPYGEGVFYEIDNLGSDFITLHVESLYWVIRKSIETWCRDHDQVSKRENLL